MHMINVGLHHTQRRCFIFYKLVDLGHWVKLEIPFCFTLSKDVTRSDNASGKAAAADEVLRGCDCASNGCCCRTFGEVAVEPCWGTSALWPGKLVDTCETLTPGGNMGCWIGTLPACCTGWGNGEDDNGACCSDGALGNGVVGRTSRDAFS